MDKNILEVLKKHDFIIDFSRYNRVVYKAHKRNTITANDLGILIPYLKKEFNINNDMIELNATEDQSIEINVKIEEKL